MILPGSKPNQSVDKTLNIIKQNNVFDKVVIVGIRGYYRDSMGVVGRNDRGIYDDAIFVVSTDCYVSFNANTDPSKYAKGIANLKAGLWKYKIGIHGLSKPKALQYKALVQASDVTVLRDELGADTGRFGINIHKGGYNTTSSLGCQTIYPAQWDLFISLVENKMNEHKMKTVPYLLVEA